MDYWLPIIVLFGAFFFMLALGVPIVYAIRLSTLASISTQLDFNSALSVVSQKLASGLDSFYVVGNPIFLSCLATL
ncbi:TRAP transporter subunit DctM [Escherichia coli]|nr:TRAP transporter subunit DctM [Escherichia coli]